MLVRPCVIIHQTMSKQFKFVINKLIVITCSSFIKIVNCYCLCLQMLSCIYFSKIIPNLQYSLRFLIGWR